MLQLVTITIDLTNNEADGYQHDLSSDNNGAVYNGDQLMLDGDKNTDMNEREKEERKVINHAPAQELDARGDREISLIISIMIFKI